LATEDEKVDADVPPSDTAPKSPGAKRRRRLGWRTAVKFWGIVLLAAVALDRGMWWRSTHRVHRVGYGVQRADLPVRWQDNLETHLLYEPSLELLWQYRPNLRLRLQCQPHYGQERRYEFRTNSHRMREVEFPLTKPADEFRIICIGDSCTAGYGVPAEQTYASQLHALLADRLPQRPSRVINAGVEGYTSFQGLQLLQGRLLPMAPDACVVAFSVNDYTPRPQSDRVAQLKLSRSAVAAQRLIMRSPVLMLLGEPLRAIMGPPARAPGATDVFRVGPAGYVENLREMVRLAQISGAAVLLLKMPEYEEGRIVPCQAADAMDLVARTSSAQIVDVQDAFAARVASGEMLHLDRCHLNARGHALVAEALHPHVVTQRPTAPSPRPSSKE